MGTASNLYLNLSEQTQLRIKESQQNQRLFYHGNLWKKSKKQSVKDLLNMLLP